MPCPLPNCPDRHPVPRDAGAPPIFREVLAAMTNSRPYRPPAVIGAHLDNARQPGGADNGAGYRWRGNDPHTPASNGGPDPGMPGDPWRRVLNR